MNIKTVNAAERVTKHLNAMIIPLHRLAYPNGDSETKDLFHRLAEAKAEAMTVFLQCARELEKQLREIHGTE